MNNICMKHELNKKRFFLMSVVQLMINKQITKNVFSKVIYLRQVTFPIYGQYHTFCFANRSFDANRSLCIILSTIQ